MITERSKSVIPFRPADAARVGEGCFYLDTIVWLNGDTIEMGDRVGFNYGCYVNGFGGLVIGDRSIFGPYTMVHTANHETDLYIPDTPQARAILDRFPVHKANARRFTNRVKGGTWIDVPFAYLPAWEAKQKRAS